MSKRQARPAARAIPLGQRREAARGLSELFALFRLSDDMWARAVVCAALLSALWPAGRTEAERDERDVQNYSYSSSNRLVRVC